MISQTDGANVIQYLLGAQAIIVTEGAATVWADFISHEAPEIKSADLLPAARRAIRDWSDGGRAWKVDPQAFVRAARKVRGDRIVAAGALPEPPADLPVSKAVVWQRRVRELLGDGLPRAQAIATACEEHAIDERLLIEQ